jgi:hypothetical protein
MLRGAAAAVWAAGLLGSADMARLGLANTMYPGEGRCERDSSRFRQYLVPLSADDGLALLK